MEDLIIKDHLINEQIRDRQLRVLGDDGEQIGILSNIDAKNLANEKDLDLVLISPQATPPVAKLMNYGKYKFELIKKLKEAKKNQKIVEVKEVQLSTTIDIGDMNTKANNAQRFIADGNRVKVVLKLKGRQMARPEMGIAVLEKFYEILQEVSQMERKPSLEGRSIYMILVPTVKKT